MSDWQFLDQAESFALEAPCRLDADMLLCVLVWSLVTRTSSAAAAYKIGQASGRAAVG